MAEIRGPFRVFGSREVYRNPWVCVREDDVEHPGGARRPFAVIEMKPGASVVAVNDREEVYLVSQYKFAVERDSLEAISGGIDPGETPLAAARRELKEEAGLEASEWLDLGAIDPFTTMLRSPNYLFMARGLREGDAEPDDGEVLHVKRVPLAEALEMVWSGRITHAATGMALLKAARALGRLK